MRALKLTETKSLGAVPLEQALESPARLMWEHNGVCTCGRRTYLLSQCFKCLKEELLERQQEELDRQNAEPDKLPDPSKDFVELPGDQPDRPLPSGPAAGAPGKGDATVADNSSREPPVPSFGIFQDRTVLKLIEQAKGRKMWVLNPNIIAMVTDWDCMRNISVPGHGRIGAGEYRTTFAVCKESVILLQSCTRRHGLTGDDSFPPAVWKTQNEMMRSGLFTPLEMLQKLNDFTRRFETCEQVTIGIEWSIRISDPVSYTHLTLPTILLV